MLFYYYYIWIWISKSEFKLRISVEFGISINSVMEFEIWSSEWIIKK